ncbi:MAG: type III polyketide synthase [Microbacteriaceae bacterium]|nr:type III polyketide synthase [Microbacteriaceae bacterium]MCL2796267.1 type III polyketide synthase [Microbacteriaceae bacterium]
MAAPRIVAIGTAVPDTVVPQPVARSILLAQPGIGRVAQRLIAAAIDGSAIEARHTVITEFAGAGAEAAGRGAEGAGAPGIRAPALFFDRETGLMQHPTTGQRNAVYAREAGPLALAAARSALAAAPGVDLADVTHVITVSCTGFAAPGVDYELVHGLGLSLSAARLGIGFMGCHAAFPALRAAVAACAADPAAVVLVVCVELCTLHLRSSEDPEQIVSASVFGDGAAAAIVTARPGAAAGRALRVDALHSSLSADSVGALTWSVGDQGFDLRLSAYVPKLLEASIDEALAPLRPARDWAAVERWAIHPGGRAILDRTQQALGLSDAQLAPSRAVLREFGNMSSPSVLFALQRLMRDAAPGETLIATAFGPGLTVEGALLAVEAGRA